MTKKIKFQALKDAVPTYFPEFDWDPVDGTNMQVIQNSKGDYFTWIPGGAYIIDSGYDESFNEFFYEEILGEYIEGFWTNTFTISKDDQGNYRSIPDATPFPVYARATIKDVANAMGAKIISYEQYFRICKWYEEIGEASLDQLFVDSSDIGNYENSSMANTGSNLEWMLGNVDCFTGNLRCWVIQSDNTYISCGGAYMELGNLYPAGWCSDGYIVPTYVIPCQVRIVL